MLNDEELIKDIVETHLNIANIVDMQHKIFDELIEPAIVEYIESQIAIEDAEKNQHESILEKALMSPIGPEQW